MDANTGGSDYGDSFVRLSTSGTRAGLLLAERAVDLDANNLDLGSGGVLLLPDQPGAHPHEMVSAGKNGTIYLVDRDNMGGFHQAATRSSRSLCNIFPNNLGIEGGNFSSPVYWNGWVYFAPVGGTVQAFKLTNGLLSTSPTSKTLADLQRARRHDVDLGERQQQRDPLDAPDRRSRRAGNPPRLRRDEPVERALQQQPGGDRDQLDEWDKFTVPVVANGKVFVTSNSQLTVYGLLP